MATTIWTVVSSSRASGDVDTDVSPFVHCYSSLSAAKQAVEDNAESSRHEYEDMDLGDVTWYDRDGVSIASRGDFSTVEEVWTVTRTELVP